MPNSFLLIIALLVLLMVTWFAGRNLKLGDWIPQLFRDGVWWAFFILFAVLLAGSVTDLSASKLRLANFLAGDRFIDLQGVSANVSDARNIYRKDTDGDEQDEWVVFSNLDEKSFGAVVYDPEPCRFTRIHTYPLIAEENDYLAEKLPDSTWLGPELSNLDKLLKNEALVIYSPDRQTLSLFRWSDESEGKCEQAEPEKRGYKSIGFFRASGSVKIREKQIATIDRNGFERSQLAIERIWFPGEKDTFLDENGRMAAPNISQINFTFDNLSELQDTYYPEKAVLAFYLTLFKRTPLLDGLNWKAEDFLSAANLEAENQEPGDPYDLGTSVFGLGAARADMWGVRVLGISYSPDKDAEQAQEARQVTIVAVGIDGEDGKEVGARKSITWKVIAEPNAGGQTEWKLSEIVRVEDHE